MAELTLFLAGPIVEPPREVGATMSRLLYRLGAVCVRRRYLALLVWAFVVAAVAAGVLVFGARTNNDIRLPGTDAQRASDLLSLSLIHISEPTRLGMISYAVFCL